MNELVVQDSPLAPNLPSQQPIPWVSIGILCGFAAVAIAALWARRRSLAGTTLVAPWCWSIIAVLSLAATEVAARVMPQSVALADHARFAVGLVTLCPWMALLGAKRPQDRGWPFIVASLWLVLAWPAAELLLYHPNRPLTLHPLRQWFLFGLWTTGLLNGVPTRHALAAVLVAAGQACMLSHQFPVIARGPLRAIVDAGGDLPMIGLAALSAGCVLWAIRLCPNRADRSGFDRIWLDFRDLYGAIWGLRVAERFNAAAVVCGWTGRLHWRGLTRPDMPATEGNAASDELPPPLRQALRSLLVRFVSEAWIAERWPTLVH